MELDSALEEAWQLNQQCHQLDTEGSIVHVGWFDEVEQLVRECKVRLIARLIARYCIFASFLPLVVF